MLIALLADIHANREALAACLAHAESSKAERYVFLGDYVGYGADPGWAVDTVSGYVARGATAIRGNHDAAVLARDPRMNETAQAAIEWTRTELTPSQCEFLAALPLTAEEPDRLFVHASAHDPARWGYVTGSGDAERSLRATRCRAVFCGHLHVPQLFNRSPGGRISEFTPVAGVPIPLSPWRRWLAVLGAVGQPRDGIPAACYGLYDDAQEVLTYIRVPYDVATAVRKVLAAGLPPSLAIRLERGS
jgi:diadenosine tetraphosphatase ApaH/serine/threonine PP2A family protein phosphatase